MAKINLAGHENEPKFNSKTFDPWKTASERGERISFIDLWLAENPDSHNVDEVRDAQAEVAHLRKLASEGDLYKGFEQELAEIQSRPYDEVAEEQSGNIELTEDTFSRAPKAAKPTFFPDF